jgi:hypothetical protein
MSMSMSVRHSALSTCSTVATRITGFRKNDPTRVLAIWTLGHPNVIGVTRARDVLPIQQS